MVKSGRIASAFVALFLFLSACATGGTGTTETPGGNGPGEKKQQLVLAMDPLISFSDGSAVSSRRDVAASMAADVQNGTTAALYDTTSWQWIHRTGETDWDQRLTRAVTPWMDGAGVSSAGAPYAYTLSDDGTDSLSVYDVSSIEVEGCGSGELSDRGILFSLTGDGEEALCYTATADDTVILSDAGNGKVALVGKVAGLETGSLPTDTACGAVVRVYRNNRMLWQGTLGNEALLGKTVTAIEFPFLENISLAAGDSLLITASMVTEAPGGDGYADVPEATSEVQKPLRVRHENRVKVPGQSTGGNGNSGTQNLTAFPFVENGFSNFGVICASSDSAIRAAAEELRVGMEKKLDAEVVSSDSPIEGYNILVCDTSNADAKQALEEIKLARVNYHGDYIIRTSGTNVIIAADNAMALSFANETFLTKWCTGPKASLPAKLNYVSSRDHEVNPLRINGNSVTDYRIVVGKVTGFMEREAAAYLQKEIVRTTGSILEVVDDSEKAAEKEILIGATNRTSNNYLTAVSKSVTDSYTISLTGNRIVIGGDSSAAINAATIAFATDLKKGSVAANYSKTGTYDGGYSLTDGYKMTWNDEFNGTQLSKTWAHRPREATNKNAFGGVSYYTTDTSYLQDGLLWQRIKVSGTTVSEPTIRTLGSEKMLYQWGYLECRFHFPDIQGLWPAFWVNGDSVYGGVKEFAEIDIFEMFCDPLCFAPNLHLWGDSHQNLGPGSGFQKSFYQYDAKGQQKAWGANGEFHTVGALWTDTYIDIYVDGIAMSHINTASYDACDLPLFIVLSGGGAVYDYKDTRPLTPGFTEGGWEWDWVRLYQKADDGSLLYVKGK